MRIPHCKVGWWAGCKGAGSHGGGGGGCGGGEEPASAITGKVRVPEEALSTTSTLGVGATTSRVAAGTPLPSVSEPIATKGPKG